MLDHRGIYQRWWDYTYWLAADRQALNRIKRLIDDALRDPVAGIGQPEPSPHPIVSAWSRRITEEHRFVHLVVVGDLVPTSSFHID